MTTENNVSSRSGIQITLYNSDTSKYVDRLYDDSEMIQMGSSGEIILTHVDHESKTITAKHVFAPGTWTEAHVQGRIDPFAGAKLLQGNNPIPGI